MNQHYINLSNNAELDCPLVQGLEICQKAWRLEAVSRNFSSMLFLCSTSAHYFLRSNELLQSQKMNKYKNVLYIYRKYFDSTLFP